MNLQRNVYEGWTPQMFIDELEVLFNMIQNNQSWMPKFTKDDTKRLKQWCIDTQPYYKKHVPEVFNYFKQRL
jgi:hypothetical protein